MKRVLTSVTFALVIAASMPALATSQEAAQESTSQPAARSALTEGEVRRVDKEAKKLTIRHGQIQNLEMPAMTMVFQVQDTALLDKVKAGDKVKFSADKIGGAIVVTSIETTN